MTSGAGELVSSMGDGLGGLDQMIAMQAEQRANVDRQRAIEGIKAGYMNAPSQEGVTDALKAAGFRSTKARQNNPQKYEADYQRAAEVNRGELGQPGGPGNLSLEAINTAMATSPLARYGVIGGAAVGGTAAMTAGAQKLIGLMEMLEEADETEVARDLPLTS